MDRCTSSKVQTAQLVRPPSRIPSPASDGIVYDRRPNKHKDDTRKHPSSFRDGTRSEGHRNGREHALVDGKKKIGDFGRAHGRLREYIFEAEVRQVSDE